MGLCVWAFLSFTLFMEHTLGGDEGHIRVRAHHHPRQAAEGVDFCQAVGQ